MRELAEETGLVGGDVAPDAGWHAVLAGMRIALMKTLRSAEPADALRGRILADLARQESRSSPTCASCAAPPISTR